MANEALKNTLFSLLAGEIQGIGFSVDDIETLCFRLNLQPDQIEGKTINTKGRNLVLYLERVDRLLDLAALIYRQHEKSHTLLQPHFDALPLEEGIRYAHYYGASEFFAGRDSERAMLSAWVSADTQHHVLCLVALGGFGKSALTWHWLEHDLPKLEGRPKRVLWWSFYESAATFDNLLESGIWQWAAKPIPRDRRGQLATLLKTLQDPDTLLIFDGFERELRAFSGMGAAYQGDETLPSSLGGGADRGGEGGTDDLVCMNPLTTNFLRAVASGSGAIRAKVLITTRLLPSALEQHGGVLIGCKRIELGGISQDSALQLFRNEGIKGTDTEIESACARYGNHPLSLRLLVSVVKEDFIQPNNIQAADRLDVTGDLRQRKNHVLENVYERLSPSARTALHTLSSFKVSMPYEIYRQLGQPDQALHELLHFNLVKRILRKASPTNEKFAAVSSSPIWLDLHPIVRHYTYARMTGETRIANEIQMSGETHRKKHNRFRDFFAAIEKPSQVQILEDLQPVIALYHHTLQAGELDAAFELYRDRLSRSLYSQFGVYLLIIELLHGLFPDGEDRPPRLKDENNQAWMLNALANAYCLSGRPRRAIPLFERHNAIQAKRDNKRNLAIGIGNVAYMAQIQIGALRAAKTNLRLSITLQRDIDDIDKGAIEQIHLGQLLSYCGDWEKAEQEFVIGLQILESVKKSRHVGLAWSYRALAALMIRRKSTLSFPQGRGNESAKTALLMAQQSLQIADETAYREFPYERDYVRAHWLLGAAYRAEAGDWTEAQRHLDEALLRCRRINLAEMEGNILIEMARVAADKDDDTEAERFASEALAIAERTENVLQQADAHLELAKLAQRRGQAALAQQHAEQALKCAYCDGPPDYTYKVAYEEAKAMLERMKGEG